MKTMKILATALCLAAFTGCATPEPSPETGPVLHHIDANGTRLTYVDQGRGTPVVFVHGSLSDWRSWEAQRSDFAREYRFISYSRRYFGTEAWGDDGRLYAAATDAADLAAFIGSLHTGPVHLVAWSSGGAVATLLALEQPALLRSLTIHEPTLPSLLAASPAGRQALADVGKGMVPVANAVKSNDTAQAARLFIELFFELPPGGLERDPVLRREIIFDNARTLPLHLAAPRPAVDCEQLASIKIPVLITRGGNSMPFFTMMSERFANCVASSRLVVLPEGRHDAPQRMPGAFNYTVLSFLKGL
jgi:pimeloyl-ACP methyl ester carboxylesterase